VLALWNAQAADAAACAAPAASAVASAACDAPAYKALRNSNEALQSWVSLHPADPLAWSMLAQGEEVLGQRLRAMRAQAESRAALGDIGGAIDRLRAAQALVRSGAANDFIEASVIDARLRQLEALRREIAAEMRGKPGSH
jgi:predicted Zn-dependent protease